MKKTNLLLIVSMLGFSGVSIAAHQESDIKITGALAAQTCQIPSNQLTKTYDLQYVSPGSANIGDVIKSLPISFSVSGCPTGVAHAWVKFEYDQDGTSDYMINTAEGKGVLFGLSSKDDTTPLVSGAELGADVDPDTLTATIEGQINAYRVSGDLQAGDILSTSNVTLIYE